LAGAAVPLAAAAAAGTTVLPKSDLVVEAPKASVLTLVSSRGIADGLNTEDGVTAALGFATPAEAPTPKIEGAAAEIGG
jgi:hypothetical protein